MKPHWADLMEGLIDDGWAWGDAYALCHTIAWTLYERNRHLSDDFACYFSKNMVE